MEKRKATNIYIERVEELVMENKRITIGAGATVNAPVVMAEHIENSFNALATAKTNEEVKALVSDLLKQVAEAGKAMPKETAEALGRDTEALTKEVTSAAPRRKWYEFTIDNIKQAAKTIGEVGEPILKTAAKLLPLLISLFP